MFFMSISIVWLIAIGILAWMIITLAKAVGIFAERRKYSEARLLQRRQQGKKKKSTGAKQTENRKLFKRKATMVNKTEFDFYRALDIAIGNEYIIMCQVAVSRLVDAIHPKYTSEGAIARNTIDRKAVDYVLCDPHNLNPEIVIELDDKSHNDPKRARHDRDISRMMKEAGITLIRFPSNVSYTADQIKQRLESPGQQKAA